MNETQPNSNQQITKFEGYLLRILVDYIYAIELNNNDCTFQITIKSID